MLGFVEALYDSQQTTKEKFAHLGKIRTTIEHTASTLEDLQHLATIEKGSLSIRSTHFSLEEELNETVLFLKSLARKQQLSLQVQVKGKIPTVILSDSLRVRELLTHLVTLFLDTTENGTVELALSLSPGDKPRLRFQVDSTGSNLPPEMVEEVAAPSSPTSEFTLPTAHGHTAISIALIKALCRSLGGEITSERSRLGQGYSLAISIDPGPLDPKHLTDKLLAHPIENSRDVKPIVIPNFSGKKFLIIEDDRDISDLFCHFLGKTGAAVERAEDGAEGVRKAQKDNYDLIFMDLQLPHVNGLEACSEMRKTGVQAPIVALTANTSLATKRKCFSLGFSLYMTKPISIERLFQLIPSISP